MPLIAAPPSRSHDRYVVTPWATWEDLSKVKKDLYSLEPGPDQRLRGVNTALAWAMRGNLPHAIQSTALLMSAKLHHEIPDSTSFSVQATYTTAFCRFITGYCDIAMENKIRKSMIAVAEELDMPASWIDLRHEATHGRLPTVKRLETAVSGALVWLWQHYWMNLDAAEGPDELIIPGTTVVPSQLHDALAKFLTIRKNEVKKRSSGTKSDDASATTCVELIRLCRGDETNLRNLVRIMVEPKMLVPGVRNPGESLQGAFIIWTPLLKALSRHQTLFLGLLLSRMAVVLTEPSYLHPPPDAFREGVNEWVVYALLNLTSASITPQAHLEGMVLEECFMVTLTDRTKNLVEDLLNRTESNELREHWWPYLEIDEMGEHRG